MIRPLCLAAVLLGLAVAGAAQPSYRLASAAGPFYPEQPDTLLETIGRYFAQAQVPEHSGRLVACVAPCSAYGYCGEVAAYAFKDIKKRQYDRVIVLGAPHFARFEGCSIAATMAYATPLGLVPVDRAAVRELCYSPFFSARALRYDRASIPGRVHEDEHCIEVLLPYLQERLGSFKLVPVLLGDLCPAGGESSGNRFDLVAEALLRLVDERTLVVVSTDFTHYGEAFDFTPFSDAEDVLESVRMLDRQAFALISGCDPKGFQRYLKKTGNNICGQNALQVLLRMLPKKAEGAILAHDLSARKTGRQDRSVSYGAIQFFDPGSAPLGPGKGDFRKLIPAETWREFQDQQKPVAANAPEPKTD